MPVYIAGGVYDGLAPEENLRALARQIPNPRLELFEGGHLFFWQDSRAYRRVSAFLRGELDAEAGVSEATTQV